MILILIRLLLNLKNEVFIHNSIISYHYPTNFVSIHILLINMIYRQEKIMAKMKIVRMAYFVYANIMAYLVFKEATSNICETYKIYYDGFNNFSLS